MDEKILDKLDIGAKVALGIDIGSTTIKFALLKDGELVFNCYERHFSQVREKCIEILKSIKDIIGDNRFTLAISGSAGLGVARESRLPFVQEVFATSEAIRTIEKDTNVVIELGGEDAKIIFFHKNNIDERMNGTCAGGTGAFIDQMATLMNIDAAELDRLSLESTELYPIASRCGVFAKTDIQPLLNQGANKCDVAASIFQAVVNQTIAGLAQGKKIEGKVVFLGGPLYFCNGLKKRFVETLKLTEENAVFPKYARVSVALGSAIYSAKQSKTFSYNDLLNRLENPDEEDKIVSYVDPLFKDEAEYNEFVKAHDNMTVAEEDISTYKGGAYLGIDCGSTTTKLVLITEDNKILYSYYGSNKGNPVDIMKEQFKIIYEKCEDRIYIKGSAVTGYGEELITHAFKVDAGIVETMAHFTSAKYFNPNVDFILDICGQDIKCFKVRNGAIDSIMLNEACSSGCGSFLETFAKNLGYSIEDFASKGLYAKHPVDLGSRCTVFMNSSVKQAQKDGATVDDISAGLSMSVVKNAIYKVIRANSAEELGENIVVQGGTFLNNAVLRSFERELGKGVTRPTIAGLMGAFGAALYSKSLGLSHSTVITANELKLFTHKSTMVTCKGCTNACHLTINIFNNNERYVTGNRCEKGAGLVGKSDPLPNLYEYKLNKLLALEKPVESKYTIGLPLSLGMYELAPLWYSLFSELGFNVVLSGKSNNFTYLKGQHTIPSDTACYPAKIMHGHIENLLEKNVDAIFYPCLSYNIDEHQGTNHYNCPVVAYYSELLASNVDDLKKTKFIYPYLNINKKSVLAEKMFEVLEKEFPGFVTLDAVKKAVNRAFRAFNKYMEDIRKQGAKTIEQARKMGKPMIILVGRPYHIDPEINHGIDRLINSLGFVVLSEDSVANLDKAKNVTVLNQWTYHSRLYNSATLATKNKDMQVVQLVSFGCGIDAITTDEVRRILESNGKLYTQIKIDEITNLGAVKIRLRSLIGTLKGKEKNEKK
ncbi:MAG: 2-hydroxyacyl-CoA dehydratase [Clostridia bacterium]|nr:2-hydroxyacyl-CoA dehydratase [Clostridia bacterium]